MIGIRHRINAGCVASVSSASATITQRDPLDEQRNHMVYLTREDLVGLLAAMDSAA